VTRVLLVEDEEPFVEEVRAALRTAELDVELTVAKDKEAAQAHLSGEFFDLLILDLRIPTAAGALDADPAHGFAIFTSARQMAPGLPILVLTSSSGEEYIGQLLDAARKVDVWGAGQEQNTVSFVKKLNLSGLPDHLRGIIQPICDLELVEIDGPDAISIQFGRLIRIFARSCRAVRAVIKPLGGGLSGAPVYRIVLTDDVGARVHNAVAKLGPLPAVRDEAGRYDTHVSRLKAAATPRKLALLEYGAKDSAAVFYQLANDFDGTAFDAAVWRTDASLAVATSLEAMTIEWSEGVPETSRSVADIRRRMLDDDDFNEIVAKHALDWAPSLERGRAQSLWCCVHGDLHGENALVNANGSAVLIDYGDVGDGSRALDPVALEFSLLFHPKGPLLESEWPTEEQAVNWPEIETYLVGCPYPEFVRSVREWAIRAAVGRREHAAAAYSYLIRQLKYDTTDGVRAKQMLDGARALFAATL